MYNWLKMLVNQICNLRRTKWVDHEVVKLMLRSLASHNSTLVTLLRENPWYEVRTLEEVLGKILSHVMMVKYSKDVEDLHQGNVPNTEPQVVAFKATREKRKEYKPHNKRVCYYCGKTGHYIAKCPYDSGDDREADNKGKNKMEKNKFF